METVLLTIALGVLGSALMYYVAAPLCIRFALWIVVIIGDE